MNTLHIFKRCGTINSVNVKCFSSQVKSTRLLVVGGGAGGLSIASKFARELPKGSVTIVEPRDEHYNQPLWTLVGGGIKSIADTKRSMAGLIPSQASWIKDRVEKFEPANNSVTLATGDKVSYEYLVVATGIQLAFDKVKGLIKALDTEGVCSNYSIHTASKTWECIQNFKEGNAIFTFPASPVKCPGAPQKIMYLAEDYFRKNGIRDKAKVSYISALPVIFGVPKYAERLSVVAAKRNIETVFRTHLVEIKPESKEAIFENLDTKALITRKYSMIHVTPPHKPFDILSPLADATGFVDVNKQTMQSTKFPNIFAIGDCTNAPCSKTAAAVAGQSGVVFDNLKAVIQGKSPTSIYDGYASCPLVTSYKTVILAEFDYNLKPLETFPFDQGKERWSMFFMKKHIIPFIYWNMLLRGLWNGPGFFRRVMGGK